MLLLWRARTIVVRKAGIFLKELTIPEKGRKVGRKAIMPHSAVALLKSLQSALLCPPNVRQSHHAEMAEQSAFARSMAEWGICGGSQLRHLGGIRRLKNNTGDRQIAAGGFNF